MKPSATMCHTQEARQHLLAANALLPNVKQIATLAAAAWAKEGVLAEKREARAIHQRLHAASEAELRAMAPAVEDRGFSENPDRGHSDAKAMLA